MLWHFDHDIYRMTYSLKVQATRINLSQGKTKLVRVDGEITLTKFKLADGIYYTQSAVPHLWDLICNLFTWPSRIEFTSAIAIFKFIPLLYKIISGRFRRGIRVLKSTKNTAVLAKWESANIDFICFANKGVNHQHRKSWPGIPRDSLRFVFQFARAAADHFLRKNRRNLRSGTMVATIACRYFPSAKRKVQCLRGTFAFAWQKKRRNAVAQR